jgi:hypothetical protein
MVHTKQIVLELRRMLVKNPPLLKVDVSITNESLTIYEALEAF